MGEWAAAFRELAGKGGHPRLLDPLPFRLRARLWLTRRIDGAAIWLLDRGHERAAIALWRVTGQWGYVTPFAARKPPGRMAA